MQIVAIFIGIFMLGAMVDHALDRPTVYESWSKQECVKVVDDSNTYSCDNLPKKYEHVWVE